MRAQELYRHYYAMYKKNMDDFVTGRGVPPLGGHAPPGDHRGTGRHTQMYDVMLPIAGYQLHDDPAIAAMQTQFFNSFMVLNFDIYNSAELKMRYPAFSETEYNRLFSARQIAQKHPQISKKNHIIAATLCL